MPDDRNLGTAHCETDHGESRWAVAVLCLSESTSVANMRTVCNGCLSEWLESWLDEQARGVAEPYELLPLWPGGCPWHNSQVGPHHDVECPLWDCDAPGLPTEGGAVEGTTDQGCSGGETAADSRAGADSREVGAVVSEALPASQEGGRGEPSVPAPPRMWSYDGRIYIRPLDRLRKQRLRGGALVEDPTVAFIPGLCLDTPEERARMRQQLHDEILARTAGERTTGVTWREWVGAEAASKFEQMWGERPAEQVSAFRAYLAEHTSLSTPRARVLVVAIVQVAR